MLDGKTILITGSSRGIGAATAELAKSYGAKVILHGRTDSEHLKNLSEELDCPYIHCNVASTKDILSSLKMQGNPSIDILVNNAGINPSRNFLELTDKDWLDIYQTNVLGPVNFSRAVLPGMIERQKGSIIHVASYKGLPYVSAKPAYSSSKAALMRLTSSMAEEFAPYGIRVNSVSPGFTKTEMTERTMSPQIQRQVNRIPFERMASPKEIAEAILFLASDKASYITGQNLVVDGGLSIV